MAEKTEHVIHSLNEYIELIKNKELVDYYFRGENKKYNSISSSLLRRDTNKLLNNGYNFYEKIINNYYSEIATNISDFERKNFIAFSQHHGLATNLIDITTSPLIALFFSCDGVSNLLSENSGYIYLFDNNNTVDISKEIVENFMPTGDCYNFLDMFISNIDIENMFKNIFRSSAINCSIFNYRDSLICECKKLNNSGSQELPFFNDYMKTNKSMINMDSDDIDICSNMIFEILEKHGNITTNKLENELIVVMIYLNLLKEFLYTLKCNTYFAKDCNVNLPKMPNLIYKTPYKFDRIRNQEGLFIYQLFFAYSIDDGDQPSKLLRQNISPDVIIKVENQKEILKELDFIGINRKFVYGDYDNIAYYINNKHF